MFLEDIIEKYIILEIKKQISVKEKELDEFINTELYDEIRTCACNFHEDMWRSDGASRPMEPYDICIIDFVCDNLEHEIIGSNGKTQQTFDDIKEQCLATVECSYENIVNHCEKTIKECIEIIKDEFN